MKNKIIIIFFIILIVAVGCFIFINNKQIPSPSINSIATSTFDGKNSTFKIDGSLITLLNGISEVSTAPGSASKITTKYFGNETTGDLNGDGLPDTAFLITQDSGGSGTFFYVVVALKTSTGYKTTNAYLIGDRIAPQTTEIHPDTKELYVNYADRKLGEPMSAEPSVGTTLYLKVNADGILEKVAK